MQIKIVNSTDINAFVAGGQRIFIFTGLLLKAETPGEVKGVIAHEVGHIAGGHLARLHDRLRKANSQAIISTLIGLAAAIGAGSSGAGAAIIRRRPTGRPTFIAAIQPNPGIRGGSSGIQLFEWD